jgi:hypothetical protein
MAPNRQISVTASSANNDAGKGWSLVSGENKIGYNLATAEADYSSSAKPASWAFSDTELVVSGGTPTNPPVTKPMGIVVEDYGKKPGGTYQDTVTFKSEIEKAVHELPAIWDGGTLNVIIGTIADGKDLYLEGKVISDNGNISGSYEGAKYVDSVGNETLYEPADEYKPTFTASVDPDYNFLIKTEFEVPNPSDNSKKTYSVTFDTDYDTYIVGDGKTTTKDSWVQSVKLNGREIHEDAVLERMYLD